MLVTENGGVKGEALRREAIAAFENHIKLLPKMSPEIVASVGAITDPGVLADFSASNVLFDYRDKQRVLEEIDPFRRLETLVELLGSESKVLEFKNELHAKVRERLEDNQREYFLKEQMKVIREELGDVAEEQDENGYVERIKESAFSDEVKEKLLKDCDRMNKMPFGSSENSVLRSYLDTVLELPAGIKTKDVFSVEKARKILDEDHDGLKKVKDRILEYIAVKQLAPDLKGQILCLIGPPGVGKSSVAVSVARALGRKFVRVSLGGVRDEADIRGHRKTYIGAMPGRIIAAITQAKSENPVILLDEIDKLTANAQGDPAAALLEVLDIEQNKAFRDHYIEIPVDLSDCIFIATANQADTIPHALYDRMEIIHLPSYTSNEKVSIFNNHLLPKQLQRHGLTRRNVKISEDAVRELIEYYTKEAGVRTLERQTAALCRKIAMQIAEGGKKSVNVTPDTIHALLGPRKVKPDALLPTDTVGVVNGLAWTELGGEMLQVEAQSFEGTGKVELTGNLGDVMQESAKAAISYIRKHAETLGIDKEFYKNRDIHIHVPEGAVPKDGPSAGVTMITALVSELSNTPVRHDIACFPSEDCPKRAWRRSATASAPFSFRRTICPTWTKWTSLSNRALRLFRSTAFRRCLKTRLSSRSRKKLSIRCTKKPWLHRACRSVCESGERYGRKKAESEQGQSCHDRRPALAITRHFAKRPSANCHVRPLKRRKILAYQQTARPQEFGAREC